MFIYSTFEIYRVYGRFGSCIRTPRSTVAPAKHLRKRFLCAAVLRFSLKTCILKRKEKNACGKISIVRRVICIAEELHKYHY